MKLYSNSNGNYHTSSCDLWAEYGVFVGEFFFFFYHIFISFGMYVSFRFSFVQKRNISAITIADRSEWFCDDDADDDLSKRLGKEFLEFGMKFIAIQIQTTWQNQQNICIFHIRCFVCLFVSVKLV